MIILLFLVLNSWATPSVLSAPLDEAKQSIVDLNTWRFHPEDDADFSREEWASTSLNDSSWALLHATKSWQEQGFPDFNGAGWYRRHILIPAKWSQNKVLLKSNGIRDQYDVYVNGQFVRHFGAGMLSTEGVPTETDLTDFIQFGAVNTLALRVTGKEGNSGIDRVITLKRIVPLDSYRSFLPNPVLDALPALVDLYWQSWRMAWDNVQFGNPRNHFVSAYMDEGYNEQIYQWDSIFMTMYGRYGKRLFPAMATLDNFYSKQEADGYIQRIYSETTGEKLLEPGTDYTVTNPPLFAWSEWDYYRMSGDSSRLARVLTVLEKYDAWIEKHQASPYVTGMYWTTGFDSGMDNMPRPNAEMAGWIDTSLQQVVAAKYLALISDKLNLKSKKTFWLNEVKRRGDNVNRWAWNAADGTYYDVDKSGKQTGVLHIGAFWSLLSGVANPDQAKLLVGHLQNPKEFYRAHLFPALSASDTSFTTAASYWAGGVWAPTNYMTIRGLVDYGYEDLAREAALNHLNQMSAVYNSDVDQDHIDPNEASNHQHTIWECYNPDRAIPCTRADAFYFGRQNFAGWTALGPITLLIEQVLGLQIIGAENRVVWKISEEGRLGLENFELGKDNLVSLVLEPEDSNHNRALKTLAQKAFSLDLKVAGRTSHFDIPKGTQTFSIQK